MHASQKENPAKRGPVRRLGRYLNHVPLLAWLLGGLAAVALEQALGNTISNAIGLDKIPALFGFNLIFKVIAAASDALFSDGAWADVHPGRIPGAVAYILVVYVTPMAVVMRLVRRTCNNVAEGLLRLPVMVSALVHLSLLFLIFYLWTDISDYRLITTKLILIAILLTFSLNLINGYMGEFSCSHPGFMALGAYAASVFSMGLFLDDRTFGGALIPLPPDLLPLLFPLGLIFGGLVAALGAVIVAVPSFKTRGDYLAIISLAFLFIVKSFLENLEFVGGPRGLAGQPDLASLAMVFCVVVVGLWIMNNFVTSTLGKGLNAVRDDETAAEAMTVNTRRTKFTAFLFAAFWAGVAGGLFAHVMRYIGPKMFGLQNLAEVLAMVYFGGLNSIYGSIVGAVSISVLGEALRPLQILKWICIPTLLILVMIYRPRGIISFKEFNVRKVLSPRRRRA